MKYLFQRLLLLPFLSMSAFADLAVRVDSSESTPSKAIIKLTIKNSFQEKVESARAAVFLMDDTGKVVGQAVNWIIGGTKERGGLAPGETTNYNFVVSIDAPFTKTKLTFNRVILEGGKLADPSDSFKIEK